MCILDSYIRNNCSLTVVFLVMALLFSTASYAVDVNGLKKLTIKPYFWREFVSRVENPENPENQDSISGYEKYIVGQTKLVSASKDSGNKVKLWRKNQIKVYLHTGYTAGDTHVSGQLADFFYVTTGKKLLFVEAKNADVDLVINVYGKDKNKNSYDLCIGYPCLDTFKNNWKYKMGFPSANNFAAKLSIAGQSYFKKSVVDVLSNSDEYYWKATEFGSQKNSAEGYFLSSDNSIITKAECYLWAGHELQERKRLVSECLVRSFGVPNAVLVGEGITNTKKVPNYVANILRFIYENDIAGMSGDEISENYSR